ncbi:MAG TPA: hypothetical protein VEY08_12245 [Chloroflexia bacterium]|nr:hypothetical protein [Chloroflexia bacterium]
MNGPQIRSRLGAGLAGAMRREACEAVPDNIDLWPQIEARLRARRSRGGFQGFVRHLSSMTGGLPPATGTQQRSQRLGRNAPAMMPLFVLVLVAWGVVAFVIGRQTGVRAPELPVYRDGGTQSSAFSGTELASDANGDMLLERVLDTARLEDVRGAGLVHQVGLSRQAGGCVAQIKQTYADANRLIIGMTAQAPGTSGGQPRMYGGIVSLGGAEYDGRNPLLLYETSTSNSSGTAARLLVYDLSLLADVPAQLNVVVEVYMSVGSASDPPSNPCPRSFRFNLAVPVNAAGTHVVQLDRALTVAGETVTLEKIISTPSATQAILRVGAGARHSGKWDYMSVGIAQLGSANEAGLDAETDPPATSMALFTGRRSLELAQRDLASDGGTWTLQVNYLEKQASSNSNSAAERLRGPWTFQFEVPAR